MLREKLENQIYVFISYKGIDPNVIIMHPKTWEQLCTQVWESSHCEIYINNELRYSGIKVFRSFDILEGEFEVR